MGFRSGLKAMVDPIPVEQGGTGAVTALIARENLDAPTLSGPNTFTGVNTFAGTITMASNFEQTAGTMLVGNIETAGLADFTGIVNLGAGFAMRLRAKSSNYTIGTDAGGDCIINCTGTFTVTLPTAVGNPGSGGLLSAGKLYIVKNSGVGVITLATTSAQTIDGLAPGTVAAGVAVRLVSDGANWITV